MDSLNIDAISPTLGAYITHNAKQQRSKIADLGVLS